jgi:cytochrome c peroxidase
MEWNFSLFFGLAVQLYESTLVSDQTPFDRFLAGNSAAGEFSPQAQRGLVLFQTKGRCINCHGGAELTNASVSNVKSQRLERMIMGDDRVGTYDNGFYNVGVRPSLNDIGLGGKDPFDNPLSMARLAQQGKLTDPVVPVGPTSRIVATGTFKVPGLRNVELTAPYFHNGGQLTLRQVVEFYNRGGDFHEANKADLDPDIERIGLTDAEKDDLVAFLRALTDERFASGAPRSITRS